VLLAARRRTLTGIVVVAAPLSAGEAAHLLAFCGPGGGHAAVVLGDLPGTHRRWTAEADGSLRLPVLDITVTVPVR